MASDLPNSRLPDEADLLAWIEGEPLPRDREQAVGRALGEDRALARKLELMRADRAAIRAMPQVTAPAGLMSAVEAALQPVLERQMLLGLREGESLADLPPISIVRPVRRSIVQTFFADRVGRRLAAAAALLLMVGGATYFGTTYLSGRTAPKPSTVAMRSEANKSAEKIADHVADKTVDAPEVRVARAPEHATADEVKEPSAPDGPTLAKAEPAPTPIAGESAPETTLADAAQYGAWAEGPFLPELDGARAADLAREGRLILRVSALDPTFRNGGIAERIRKSDSSMIRMGDDTPPAVASLLAPPAREPEQRQESAPYSPAVASGSSINPEPPAALSPPTPSWTLPPEQSVYMVQVRLDSAALDTLRGSLSGGYGEAQYEELSEPLPEGTGAVNPASVVWWSQGPAAWAGWAGVPVVVSAPR